MRKLTTETIRFVKEQSIGMKYNTSMEELVKLQESYNKSIGRSIALTNSQKETMAAMRKVAGDETTIKFATSLENFGLNPDEVGGVVGKMFETASRSGVAWSKYSDNFLNNIKTAQNYTFRNGLEGLQSMAKKAAEIKLDMKQAEAFVQASPQKIWKAGIYTRISVDINGEKRESLETQKLIALSYAESHPDIEVVKFYKDDGISGTKFDRDDFVRMLGDIKTKEINTVIVKDLSRFGRDLEEVSKYLEKINVFEGRKIEIVYRFQDELVTAARLTEQIGKTKQEVAV